MYSNLIRKFSGLNPTKAKILDFVMRRLYKVRMLHSSSNLFKSLAFLVISGALAACTSGDGSPTKTPYCRPSAKPIKMEDDSAQRKIDVKPNEDLKLAAGTYEFTESSFYIRDYDRDIIVHVGHKPDAKPNEDGVIELDRICFGGTGIRPGMKPFAAEIELITSMTVDEHGETFVNKKRYAFEINDQGSGWRSEVIETATQEKGSLSDLYHSKGVVTQKLFVFPGDVYEARATIEEVTVEKGKKGGIESRTQVKYKFTAPPSAVP